VRPDLLSPTAWAALAGAAWGLGLPGWLGPLMLVAGAAAARGSLTGHPVADVLRGVLAGTWWFALALRWAPEALARHGDPPDLAVPLLALQALPLALPWGLASLAVRRGVDPGVALGLAWAVAVEPLAWVQPLPVSPAILVPGVPLLLWPAALGGPALLTGLAVGGGALLPRPVAGLVLGVWALVGAVWIDQPIRGASVRVGLVQPDLVDATARRSDLAERDALRVLGLVLAASDDGADLVVGPEAAWPWGDDGDPAVWGGLPPTVIGGAGPGPTNRVWAFDGGAVVGTYDKRDLLPGVERALGALGRDAFRAGDGPRHLALAGLGLGPLVCYEVLLPWALRDVAGADLVVVPTSDLALDAGPGARWHLAAAQLAAAGTGRPLARATTSGVSAIVDPAGRVVARLDVDPARADGAPGRYLVAEVVVPTVGAGGLARQPGVALGAALALALAAAARRPTRQSA
jgi:apolipoprotein N-acyltransferase